MPSYKHFTAKDQQEFIVLEELARKERARTRFMSFATYLNPVYDPQWYHRYICEKLEAFCRGEIPRLMIFMPPRHGKSELVSRLMPAYILGKKPTSKVIIASYSGALSGEMNIDCQRYIDSQEYKSLFPDILINDESGRKYGNFKRSSNRTETFSQFINDNGSVTFKSQGGIRAVGTGGAVTGFGANFIIIDDIHKNQAEADSIVLRDKAHKFYSSTLYTRLEEKASILLTMTRWHEDDLAARLLKEAEDDPKADQWEVLRFPAIAEEMGDRFYDTRKSGEALWESRYPHDDIVKRMKSVGTRVATALFQQRPTPLEGGLFKRQWWRYWETLPMEDSTIVQFWDSAQKVGITNDYSVCATWMKTRSGYYLIDLWRGKVEAPELENLAVAMFNKHLPSCVVIEDKSSGSSLLQYLRRNTTIPVLAYDPKQRDKEVRASAATPTVEAGNCYLPKRAPWLEDFIGEHERFPNGANDDTVDTTSMMVEYFNKATNYQPRVRRL